jgi:hypothetical protein
MKIVKVAFNGTVTEYPDCSIVRRDPFLYVLPRADSYEEKIKEYFCVWYKDDPGVSAIVIDQDKVHNDR